VLVFSSGISAPLRDTLLTQGDHYMHLTDLAAYLEADRKLVELYAGREGWARKAILNMASSESSPATATMAEYTAEIWHAKACPLE
jgi:glycogen phosphorylase